VIVTIPRTLPAGEVRTGDVLISGQDRNLVIATWRRGRDVVMSHPNGNSTISAEATVQVQRRSRVVNHDAQRAVAAYSTD
jgi:hypothetical protein